MHDIHTYTYSYTYLLVFKGLDTLARDHKEQFVSAFQTCRHDRGANYLQGKKFEFSIQKLSNLLSFAL